MGIFDWIRQRAEDDDDSCKRVREAFDEYEKGEITSRELIDKVKYENFEADLKYQNKKVARELGMDIED